MLGLVSSIGCNETRLGSSSAPKQDIKPIPTSEGQRNSFDPSTKEPSLSPESIEQTVWEGCCPAGWNERDSFYLFAMIEFRFKEESASNYTSVKTISVFHSGSSCRSSSDTGRRKEDISGSIRKMIVSDGGQSATGEHSLVWSRTNSSERFPLSYRIVDKTTLIENLKVSYQGERVDWNYSYRKKS